MGDQIDVFSKATVRRIMLGEMQIDEGMACATTGSGWFLSGSPNAAWGTACTFVTLT